MSISNNLGLKLYGDDLLLYKPISIEKGSIHLCYRRTDRDVFCF